MIATIIKYLEKEKSINEDALKVCQPFIFSESETEIRLKREIETIKLRDRICELKKHIEVIKEI